MKEQKEWTDAAGEREGNWNFRALYFPPTLSLSPLPSFPLLPSPSPPALDLRSFTMRGAALFSSVMNGRYTCYGAIFHVHCRHCNFPPRHRHRYHELVIDAFHYSRGDDSTETATYRSSGRVNFSSTRDFLLFYIPRRGSFPEGKTKIRVDRIGYGGGEREGEWREGKRKGKSKEMKRGTWCRNTRYNLWRMWDGMKINKVR